MPNSNGPIDLTNAAGVREGGKPKTVPAPSAASSELSPRPQHRTFSAAAKLRILQETDRAADTGGIAAILRREGLYSSTLTDWRRQRDGGAFEALKPLRCGPKRVVVQPTDADLSQLRRETLCCVNGLSKPKRSLGSKKLGQQNALSGIRDESGHLPKNRRRKWPEPHVGSDRIRKPCCGRSGRSVRPAVCRCACATRTAARW